MQPSDDYQCPPWFVYNTATERCECYTSPKTKDIVKCSLNERAALLKYGYCMTYSKEDLGRLFVGKCQYFEIQGHNLSDTPGYITLPGNISELNEYMCGPMNRQGLVCSECIEGFGPSVTSLGYSCSKCAWYSVPLFLVCAHYSILCHHRAVSDKLDFSSIYSFCTFQSICHFGFYGIIW